MIVKAAPTQLFGFASISDKLPPPHVGLGHDSRFEGGGGRATTRGGMFLRSRLGGPTSRPKGGQ